MLLLEYERLIISTARASLRPRKVEESKDYAVAGGEGIVVVAPGITSCTLSFTGMALVADDLAFVVPSSEIPTLSEWGLLVFTVLLAVFGVLRLRPS